MTSTPPSSGRSFAPFAPLGRWIEAREAWFTKSRSTAVKLFFGAVMGFTIMWSFFVPELPNFQAPDSARIFFWHFPCPIIGSLLLIVGAWWSWKYLQTKDLHWDVKAAAALEIGYMFSVLTMISGIIFSKAQWGAWWQSDPRQTSYLLVLMIYSAYFVLRGAYNDRDRKAATSAGYSLMATLPTLFLTFIFPHLPQIAAESFHPSTTIWTGQIHGSYAQVITATLILVSLLAAWVFRIRVRAGLLELKTYELLGLETSRRAAAAPRVVRPVRLPPID